MKISSGDDYNKSIANRIRTIMVYANLEIPGFSILTGLSESHIYSLLSLRRKLTDSVAEAIGNSLNFEGNIIFNLNTNIPESIKRSENLSNFNSKYKYNKDYFISTKFDRKPAYFLKFELVESDFLNSPKYLWEINSECERLGRKFISDNLSNYLKYFAKKGLIESKKAPLKRRDGTYGKRMVEVFFKPKGASIDSEDIKK